MFARRREADQARPRGMLGTDADACLLKSGCDPGIDAADAGAGTDSVRQHSWFTGVRWGVSHISRRTETGGTPVKNLI